MKIGIFVILAALVLTAQAKLPAPSPVKACYIDLINNWSNPAQTFIDAVDSGFNVLILAFYLSATGATDALIAWSSLDNVTKTNTLNYIHNKGGLILMSLGGATDLPFGMDPNVLGTSVGQFAVANQLDGVDFDLENIAPYFTYPPMNSDQFITWVSTLTTATKNQIGNDGYISHVPQAPYFGPMNVSLLAQYWTGTAGGFSGVYNQVGNIIDFIFVQDYNQGTNCYNTYNSIFVSAASSGCTFIGTSLKEISTYGIPMNKLILTKPMLSNDASNGFTTAANLNSWIQMANQNIGYNGGIATWQFHTKAGATTWLNTIYGTVASTTGIPLTTAGTTAAPQTTGTTGIPATTGTTGIISTGTITTGSGSTTGSGTNYTSICASNCRIVCN